MIRGGLGFHVRGRSDELILKKVPLSENFRVAKHGF